MLSPSVDSWCTQVYYEHGILVTIVALFLSLDLPGDLAVTGLVFVAVGLYKSTL
jgi:hypothetical protein